MAAVAPEELIRLWASEQITAEHAIGQLVQQLAQVQSALEAQRRTLAQVQSELAALRSADEGPTPSDDGRRKSRDQRRSARA
jgi:hypothetical protein